MTAHRTLTYNGRRWLKTEVDRRLRERIGARSRVLDLSEYPVVENRRHWTDDEIVHFVEMARDALGVWPRRNEYDDLRGGRRGGDPRMPTSDVAVRRFGSWTAAVAAASKVRA
jgi:hypothetical protein